MVYRILPYPPLIYLKVVATGMDATPGCGADRPLDHLVELPTGSDPGELLDLLTVMRLRHVDVCSCCAYATCTTAFATTFSLSGTNTIIFYLNKKFQANLKSTGTSKCASLFRIFSGIKQKSKLKDITKVWRQKLCCEMEITKFVDRKITSEAIQGEDLKLFETNFKGGSRAVEREGRDDVLDDRFPLRSNGLHFCSSLGPGEREG
ncbi:hypothetical protein ACFX19_029364 [Malus domestica]